MKSWLPGHTNPLILLLIAWAVLALPAAAEPVRPGHPYLFANLGEERGDRSFSPVSLYSRPIGVLSLFLADDEFGRTIWRTDGTTEGTFRVADFCPGPCVFSAGSFLARSSGSDFAFASSYDGATDSTIESLWRTDGTADGTRRLVRGPFRDMLRHHAWAMATGRLVFTNATAAHGRELWVSDGTEAGTFLLVDVLPGPVGSDPSDLFEHAGQVFFTADDGVHGSELWRTDGTAAGTRRVTDLYPGSESSFARVLGTTGERLLLSAYRPDIGTALWSSDGTVGGSRLAADVHPPGRGVSPPWPRTVSGCISKPTSPEDLMIGAMSG